MNQNIRYITEIAILTAMITVLGAIKIPNIIPGIEFQLSAPLAVAICAVFGFKKYIISGIIFTIVFGSLLHFFYDWSGKNAIVGLFSPINESVFEHLKLLYFPMLLWIVLGYFIYGKKNRNYFLSSFIGLVCGLILTPVLFYLYTSYTKTSILPVDIGIFVISVVVSFALFAYIFLNYNFNFFSVKMGILLWELVFAMFIISYLLQ